MSISRLKCKLSKGNRDYKYFLCYANKNHLHSNQTLHQDYERQQVKLERQGKRTSSSLSQLSGNQSKLELVGIFYTLFHCVHSYPMQSHRAVATSRADYERVHDRLMLEVPQLLDNRVDYFDTCLSAVMKAQV